MSTPRELVLGSGTGPAEDELRLPREPGVIRRFWSRHPLLTDILLAVLALLLSYPAIIASAPLPEPPSVWSIAVAIALSALGCVGLIWRRRRPVVVFIVTMLPMFVVEVGVAATVGGPACVIALYSIAVYRNVRACWIAFASATVAVGLNAVGYSLFDGDSAPMYINLAVSTVVGLLIGALIGVNVGNRRRYLDALIQRSRQLVVERNQQAKLATASERARIAREMHDIVSHSLTVVVALAEGASATADPELSREATRAVATTAREALTEMRMMLGVLRTDDDGDAPRGPVLDTSLHDVVEAARAAGFPVTLTVSGDPDVAGPLRLAVLRTVQEAITNAMRYSHAATFVRARTDYTAAAIHVDVENDGALTAAVSEGSGWGLQGLDERITSLGGTITAGMARPGVWRLTADLPRAGGDV